MTEGTAPNVEIDIRGVAGPVRYAAAIAGRTIFVCLRSLENASLDDLQLPQIGLVKFSLPNIAGDDNEVRELCRNWLLARGFHHILRGLQDSLEEAFVVCELLALNGVKLPRSLPDLLNAKRKWANRQNFPQLLAAVNERLTAPLNLTDAINSLQAVRNCLEHRRGIVREKDSKGADGLTILIPTVEIWIQRNDGTEEHANGPVLLEAGEAVRIKFGTEARTVAVGDRLHITAEEFLRVAMVMLTVGDELVTRLPDTELSG